MSPSYDNFGADNVHQYLIHGQAVVSECLTCVAIKAGPDSPCRHGNNNILPKYGFHHRHVDHADDDTYLAFGIFCLATNTVITHSM